MKFGVFTGEIWPQFPRKTRLCSFHYAYTTCILPPGNLWPSGSHAKAKFSTDRGAVLLKFFSQKITLQASERIKKKDCGTLDGISSVKIDEKVRLFHSDTIACLDHMVL